MRLGMRLALSNLPWGLLLGRHAEFVIGQPADGVEGNVALLKWIAEVGKLCLVIVLGRSAFVMFS